MAEACAPSDVIAEGKIHSSYAIRLLLRKPRTAPGQAWHSQRWACGDPHFPSPHPWAHSFPWPAAVHRTVERHIHEKEDYLHAVLNSQKDLTRNLKRLLQGAGCAACDVDTHTRPPPPTPHTQTRMHACVRARRPGRHPGAGGAAGNVTTGGYPAGHSCTRACTGHQAGDGGGTPGPTGGASGGGTPPPPPPTRTHAARRAEKLLEAHCARGILSQHTPRSAGKHLRPC